MAHMEIEIPHEGLDAADWRAVGVAEVVGQARLQRARQDLGWAIGLVVQFVADAEQEIVGLRQLPLLLAADQSAMLEFGQGAGAILEVRHPQKILIIAEAAAPVLDVGLEHRSRVAVLGTARRLVL